MVFFMSILQTTELKKYYGTEPNITRALDGVNFSVEEGEFVAVVGTSGSGKSTLLHMMGGLDTPTSGTVIVRGEELAKKNDLKNSMSAGLTGGLDSLIQSTAGQKEAQKPKKAKTVHCNFVMDETYHQNLKLIAIRKGDSLKSVLQEAISDYLDKNSSLL